MDNQSSTRSSAVRNLREEKLTDCPRPPNLLGLHGAFLVVMTPLSCLVFILLAYSTRYIYYVYTKPINYAEFVLGLADHVIRV